MNSNQRNRLSIFLMSASLLLLMLFLCFWLKNVYEKEYTGLEAQTNYVFSESSRFIKDEILDELMGSAILFENEDSSDSASIKIKLNPVSDLTKLFSAEGVKNKRIRKDSSRRFEITKRTSIKESDDLQREISLSMVIAKDMEIRDSICEVIHGAPHDTTNRISRLRDQFYIALEETDLPKGFEILNLEDLRDSSEMLISESYQDIFSGESYAATLKNYQPYLLKRMIPEFLFSLFLFSCIAISFLVIYRSLQRQRKLTQLKNDFVSNVTHELKTPITTVGVAIEALSDFEVLQNPERTKEYLNISKHELNRLSILVDKVLKMSLFEKKEPELKLESLNMNVLIKDILDTMKLQFEKKHADVHFNPLPDATAIEGDRIHLTSVVYNLIDNALKYSHGTPKINIGLEHSHDRIKLSLADKGIGIAKEFKEKIFEKFFRVPTGDRHNIKGYGLGLSYVASVVKKHQGSIEVASDLNNGTCFTIYLPKRHGEN